MELGAVFFPRCLPLNARHSDRLLRQNGYDGGYSKHPALCPAPNRDLIDSCWMSGIDEETEAFGGLV